MLHYDRRLTTDSIAYYTRAAQEALPADASVRLQARQALCNAYVAYYQWAWLEVDMFCAYGKELLRAQRQEEYLLYAALLSVQGVARKQMGLTLRVEEERRRVWRQSLSVMTEAYRTLAARRSPWRSIALEDIKLLSARLDAETLAPFAWLLPPLDTVQYVEGYVNEDRFRAYVHYLAGRADSSVHYYERVRERGAYFRSVNKEEAMALGREQYVRLREYGAALKVSEDMLDHMDCCPEATTFTASGCMRNLGCSFDLSDAADIFLERYRAGGNSEDLRLAHQLAQRSIDHYREALSMENEESTFNRLNTLGERLIDRAITAAWFMLQRQPTDGLRDTLLHTVEVGKAHLLSADLQASAIGALANSTRQTRNKISRLKEQYTQQLRLPVAKLEAFVRLATRRGQARVTYPDFMRSGAMLSIAAVRDALTPEQALVEYAEVNGSLLGLYIDQDTAIIKMLSLSSSEAGQLVSDFTGRLAQQVDVPLAEQLYVRLLGPFDAVLGYRSELLIVPSVTLAELPFAVLRPPGEGKYLIDHCTLRYLESWRSHRYTSSGVAFATQPIPPRMGIWTHPDLTAYFTPVNDALRRVPAIEVTRYEAEACTARSYLQQSAQYDWLQLSVHARGNAQLLHDNYFFLNARDSLSGQRIAAQPLAARLVVLAACSGSAGFRSRMEGTLSLRRSFKRTGVPYVVASLYDIPAAASAVLLAEFYRQLLEQEVAPEVALARAQRRCLRGELGERWRRPYAWAGLVVS